MTIQNRLRALLKRAYTQRPARVFLVAAAFLAIIVAAPAIWAQQLNVLANFEGANGEAPNGSLVLDRSGNVYGTTFYGGPGSCSYGCGTVFKLSHQGSQWTLAILYDFRGGADGAHPWAGVTFGPDGALYGTTNGGGNPQCQNEFFTGCGTVFKLTPPATICRAISCPWTKTILYSFNGGSDGGGPEGALVFDHSGNMYGTTYYGGQGSGYGNGVVFEVSPSPGGWTESAIHAFAGGSDGSDPENGVVLDSAGNVYGSTYLGGANNLGVVYELSYSSSGWTEAILYTFSGNSEGPHPDGLVLDAHGNIYGPTFAGGDQNDGEVFELQPTGDGFTYSVIYIFQAPNGGPGSIAALALDSAGNLYGSGSGGTDGYGIVYELSPSGGSWNFNVLWNFNLIDGFEPFDRVTLDAQGNLYGVTEYGGERSDGVVWQLTP